VGKLYAWVGVVVYWRLDWIGVRWARRGGDKFGVGGYSRLLVLRIFNQATLDTADSSLDLVACGEVRILKQGPHIVTSSQDFVPRVSHERTKTKTAL
jgi:hypothetical protein